MDKKRTVLQFILQYIGITIASIMYAMALAWFLNPNQLAPGGVSGIAIVLKEIFPFLPGKAQKKPRRFLSGAFSVDVYTTKGIRYY